MARSGLVVQGLTAGYIDRKATREVVRGVNATVAPGDVICLLGVNGAGKSTLLRTLIGAQPALEGHVTLDGRPVPEMSARERAQRVAVLLTDRIDVPLAKVEEIVALGRLPHQGWLARMSAEDKAAVARALVRAGAERFVGRAMNELSDGERQRVMLARALAQEPSFLVLDEPTAFLDAVRRVELLALLRQLADEGLAILMSLHDVDVAVRCADALWIIGDDKTLDVGAPEDLALAGRVGSAFDGEDARFDHDTGTFVPVAKNTRNRSASVDAPGVEGIWARRALERANLAIAEGPADVTLRFDPLNSNQPWSFSASGRTRCLATLGEVVREARA